MNEQRFTRFQAAALEYIMPNRHQRLWRSTRFQYRERRRRRHRLGVLRDAILRVAATGDQRHHLVAELVLPDVAAERDHFAGYFEAGQVARAGRRRIAAGTL